MKGFYDAILISMSVIVLLPSYLASPAINPSGSYSDPTNDQFHIQTDEGPERYFRYQTQSGQYRKEKRLEDGTVVGSFGWIDSTGLLRLQDYIADNAGYRILRTKDIYVGKNRPISQAIKAAKKVPGVSGTSVSGVPLGNAGVYLPPVSQVPSTTSNPVTSVTPSYISTSYNPFVDISYNSYPGYSTTPSPVSNTVPPSVTTSSPFESSSFPPLNHLATPTPTPATVVISPKAPYPTYIPSVSSTPSPFINSISSTLAPLPTASPSPSPVFITTHRPSYSGLLASLPSTPQPTGSFYDTPTLSSQNSNALDDYYDSNENPYLHHNGPTYPIDRDGNSYFGRPRPQNRQPPASNGYLGNGYDPQYPQYNGVSVTNDGFRYYIPRAYHEEQDTGFSKSGSFGYIDPFGIRRVVYYNAGADGFQHRKNNRYVGFNATPYDPRPYKKRK